MPGHEILPAPSQAEIKNPAWDKASARILIVRLSPFFDVDISTSHHVLYAELAAAENSYFIDFSFFPGKDQRALYQKSGNPWFTSIIAGRSPKDFDLIMVSNAYALELINLPYLFSTAGIPLSARKRMESEDSPLVILGGSNAAAAGAVVAANGKYPASDALVDGIFFGEAEGAVTKLVYFLCDTAKTKRRRLAAAASIPGFWPCLLSEGTRRQVSNLRPASVLKPLLFNGPNAKTVRLAITAGCPGYCSFCLEGWDRRPYREKPLAILLEEAQVLKKNTGADTLEIYSFNFNTHQDIFNLIFSLNRIFMKVSFMSQRLDILAANPRLFKAELAGGKRSFTLGIEGISGRMRSFYRKGFTDKDLATCIDLVAAQGVKELKLFYILSGFENEADLTEFDGFLKELAEKRRNKAPGLRILVSAGYLVRLPFTPLQYAPLVLDRDRLEKISSLLETSCLANHIEFRLASNFSEYYIDQLMTLGGHLLFGWLNNLPASGIVFDGTADKKAYHALREFIARNTIAFEPLMAEKDASFTPDFGFMEPPSHFATLFRHYREASEFKNRPLCLGSTCSGCEVCDSKEEIRFMTSHTMTEPKEAEYAQRLAKLMEAKARFKPVFIDVAMSRDFAFSSSEYREASLLKYLFAAFSGSDRLLFTAKELIFSKNEAFESILKPWYGRFGMSRFALYGPDPARSEAMLAEILKKPSADSGLVSLLTAQARAPAQALKASILCPPMNSAVLARLFGTYLTNAGLSPIMRKSSGKIFFDLTAKSIQKKMIISAVLAEGENPEISIACGHKTDLSALFSMIEDEAGRPPLLQIVEIVNALD